MNAWGRIKCWLRGNHEWKLEWGIHEFRDHVQHILIGSTCLRCGKNRVA